MVTFLAIGQFFFQGVIQHHRRQKEEDVPTHLLLFRFFFFLKRKIIIIPATRPPDPLPPLPPLSSMAAMAASEHGNTEDTLILRSQEGEVFQISKDQAKMSKLVETMIDADQPEDEIQVGASFSCVVCPLTSF